jgi:hypothetical protein
MKVKDNQKIEQQESVTMKRKPATMRNRTMRKLKIRNRKMRNRKRRKRQIKTRKQTTGAGSRGCQQI